MEELCSPFIKSAQVQCPFYITDDRFAFTLTCEGYDEDHVLMTRFRNHVQKYSHMKMCCAKNFKKCPIFKLVMSERYEVEE